MTYDTTSPSVYPCVGNNVQQQWTLDHKIYGEETRDRLTHAASLLLRADEEQADVHPHMRPCRLAGVPKARRQRRGTGRNVEETSQMFPRKHSLRIFQRTLRCSQRFCFHNHNI